MLYNQMQEVLTLKQKGLKKFYLKHSVTYFQIQEPT